MGYVQKDPGGNLGALFIRGGVLAATKVTSWRELCDTVNASEANAKLDFELYRGKDEPDDAWDAKESYIQVDDRTIVITNKDGVVLKGEFGFISKGMSGTVDLNDVIVKSEGTIIDIGGTEWPNGGLYAYGIALTLNGGRYESETGTAVTVTNSDIVIDGSVLKGGTFTYPDGVTTRWEDVNITRWDVDESGNYRLSKRTQSEFEEYVQHVLAKIKPMEGIKAYIDVDGFLVDEAGERLRDEDGFEMKPVCIVEVPGNSDPFDGKYLEYFSDEHARYLREARRQHFRGLAGSPEWLRQVYLSYLPLDCRLYAGGKQIMFKEKLIDDPNGYVQLVLTSYAYEQYDQVSMKIGQDALEVFRRSGVTSIVVKNGDTTDTYAVADILKVLSATGLADAQAILLNGMDGDVQAIDAAGATVPVEM